MKPEDGGRGFVSSDSCEGRFIDLTDSKLGDS